MTSVIVKAKKIKSGEQINSLFQDIFMESSSIIDANQTWERYNKLKKICNNYVCVINELKRYAKSEPNIVKIDGLCGYIRTTISELFTITNMSEYSLMSEDEIRILDKYEPYIDERTNLIESYKYIKKSNLIKMILDTYKNMIRYDSRIKNELMLKDDLLRTQQELISKLNINISYLYCNAGKENKYAILYLLHLSYKYSKEVYSIISEPDINIDIFVDIVIKVIEQTKHSLPRCTGAFNKILGSVHIFKTNFSKYHRTATSINNPASIIEDFINDVGKEVIKGSGKSLATQFRMILMHFKNKINFNPKNQTDNSIISCINTLIDDLQNTDEEIVDEEPIAYEDIVADEEVKIVPEEKPESVEAYKKTVIANVNELLGKIN